MEITEQLSPGQNATLQLIQVWKGWNFGIYFLARFFSVWFNPSQLMGSFTPNTLRENSLLQQH